MLFQPLDDKNKCVAIYFNGNIVRKKLPKNITSTWDYSEFLGDREVKYAKYYCRGQSLDEVCPKNLRKNWGVVKSRLEAFYRSMNEAGLPLSEHCFYDMVPEQFLIDFCRVKNQICNFVFKNYEKPDDYEHMVSLAKVLTEIKNKKLNIDLDQLSGDLHKFKVRQFVKKTKTLQPYITYDQFKAKTGRLTTKRSFPILTMDKTYRKILKPNNDWFVEFDFNAAELRVLLGLLGEAQPQQDIHDWNAKNVYQGQITRDEAKKRIFAWLYNPASKDHLSSRIYKREAVVSKYYNNGQVTNFFNRKIEADEHHAPNYIIQSTAADLFLRQMIKLWEALKDKKSYIAFCLHDSLVIDFSEEDQFSLNDLKEIFAQTALGKFKVNVSAGKNYGDMKKLKVY